MTPAAYRREVKAWQWRQEQEQERRKADFYDMLNACGTAFHGKEWKHITPPDHVSAPDDFDERWKRAMRLEAEAVARHQEAHAEA